MIGTIVPQVQAAVASAGIIKNMLAGLVPRPSKNAMLEFLAKDIGGFEFDYIGEETLTAGADVTDHFTEENFFIQDHRSLKPIILTARGFITESDAFFKSKGLRAILSQLQSVLAVVQPYQDTYAPGTSAKIQNIVSQADDIVNQLSGALNTINSVKKLFGSLQATKVQKAFIELDQRRKSEYPVAVLTPFKTFDNMLITEIRMTNPEETRGLTDIIVTLKEIRFAETISSLRKDPRKTGLAPGDVVV